MKKLLYTIMFITGVVGTLCMLFTPIYKFDETKIKANNTEMIAMIIDPELVKYRDNSEYYLLTEESKQEYKNNYYIYNQLAYAIINNDQTLFYEINDYEVLNAIYKDTLNADGTLDHESTDETISAIEKTLKDLLGEEEFNTKKEKEVNKEIENYKNDIYKRVKESMELSTTKEAEEFLIRNAQSWICDEFLVLFVGYDQYLIDSALDEIGSKGIYLKHIFTAWSNAYQIDKAVWQKTEYQELGFFEKCKAVYYDVNFYNPLPLFGLTLVIGIIFVGLILLIFKGLKGMRGVKYPHAFISSIINGACCLGLFMLPPLIPLSYHMNYHYTEYSRLLNMFAFGSFSIAIVIALFIFAIALGISVFGRFFRWGKRRRDG